MTKNYLANILLLLGFVHSTSEASKYYHTLSGIVIEFTRYKEYPYRLYTKKTCIRIKTLKKLLNQTYEQLALEEHSETYK